jgi:hypothetical protein
MHRLQEGNSDALACHFRPLYGLSIVWIIHTMNE